MKKSDIVIINFPFTSFDNSKIRPALVISNEKFNKGKNVILLAISSRQGNSFYSMPISQKDLASGNLLKQSFVRFNNILSIEKKLILKKVASLKLSKTEEILRKMIDFLK